MPNSRDKVSHSKTGLSLRHLDTSEINNNRNYSAARSNIDSDNVTDETKLVRVVDLFSGCGGLTLGFELYKEKYRFQSVLALDNSSSALSVFNKNFPQRSSDHAIGRLADLTWFSHRSEILLFYLAHYCQWLPDHSLSESLDDLGYCDFLNQLRAIDSDFSLCLKRITQDNNFHKFLREADASVFSLALSKSVSAKIGVTSLRHLQLDTKQLPWCEEYSHTQLSKMEPLRSSPVRSSSELSTAAVDIWNLQVERIREATSKIGKGQHITVSKKMKTVLSFLESPIGLELKKQWVSWRSSRDTLRATYCLSVESTLDELYNDGRAVDLVLGGPPCKGWSRIGRAVIESLREQGVHAWASHHYGDERNELLHNYVLFLGALRPAAFVFENVAHFESALRTPSGSVNAATELEKAVNLLTKTNTRYRLESGIVSAKSYSVPQDRSRYIMIGFKSSISKSDLGKLFFKSLRPSQTEVPLRVALTGLPDPEVYKHGAQETARPSQLSAVYNSIGDNLPTADREFISWIRQQSPFTSSSSDTVDSHIVRAPRADDKAFFRHLAPGLRWMDYKFANLPTVNELSRLLEIVAKYQRKNRSKEFPSVDELEGLYKKLDDSLVLRLLLEGSSSTVGIDNEHHLLDSGYLSKGSDMHGDWLERLSPDRPCKTIVAHIGKDTYGYIHPTQPRALSIREAARVQTFPDFFQFGNVGIVDSYSMIGNAVPPLLAFRLAEAIVEIDMKYKIFQSSGDKATSGEAKTPCAAE